MQPYGWNDTVLL